MNTAAAITLETKTSIKANAETKGLIFFSMRFQAGRAVFPRRRKIQLHQQN
ncbi:hypothetical protein N9B69_02185 [Amylibacter sp.]|nr:hypothetical protein [Amylibacter sp.]